MDTMRLEWDGTVVELAGGLIGLDADGGIWASQAAEGYPLADGDLQGILGSRAVRLGSAMQALASQVESVARGVPGAREADQIVRQGGVILVVPAANVGEEDLHLQVPHGVLAIGPDLDVWRTVGRPLWHVNPKCPSELTSPQAAEVALEAKRRWQAFVDEQLREWLPPMSAGATLPESPRFA